jgi:hypothetical protein
MAEVVVAFLSLQRPRFKCSAGRVGFVVDIVALGQVLLHVVCLFLSVLFLYCYLLLFIHLLLIL